MRQNVRDAEEVAIELMRLGYAVYCPHKATYGLGGLFEHWQFVACDLAVIDRCDGVVMLPEWAASEGARQERAHAETTRREVYEWPHDIALLRERAPGWHHG